MAVISEDHADESYNVEHLSAIALIEDENSSSYNDSDARSGIISSNSLLTEEKKDSLDASDGMNRYFTIEQVQKHNIQHNQDGNVTSFWCCIDGFVVDATEYLNTRVHPGGQKKVLQTNDAKIGNDNKPMSFSFSKGKNAHFPETAKVFQDGVKDFLNGGSNAIFFPEVVKKNGDVGHGGKIFIIGRLLRSEP